MKKITIFFRCEGDTGKNFGMGHIYRSISLAKSLKKKNYKIFFITNSSYFITKFIKSEISCNIISTEMFLKKINEFLKKKIILINDTFGKCNLFGKLSNKYKLKIVDFDNLNISFSNGILINSIVHYKKKPKQLKNIKYFGGFKYLILRDLFQKKKKLNKEKNTFLVSSGGSDSKKFLSRIATYLLKFNLSKIYILVGPAVKKNNIIFKTFNENKKVKLLHNIKNPKKYIDKSEFALVSGGTICFESVVSKCRTGCIQNYHHQIYASKYLQKKKLIVNFGKLSQLNFFKFKKKLLYLINQKSKNLNSQKIIDKLGTKRVTDILLSYINE